MAVLGRERDHQRRERFRQWMRVLSGVGHPHLLDTRDLRRRLRDSSAVAAGNQQMYRPAYLLRGGKRVESGRLESGIIVFGDDQNAHS